MAANARDVVDATGHEDVGVGGLDDRLQQRQVRLQATVREDEAVDTGIRKFSDELQERWCLIPPPGEGRQPLGPRIEAHGEPVARHRDAIAQALRLVDDGHGQQHARGAGREREADVVGLLHAARELDRHSHALGHGGHGLQVCRRSRARPVEVDEVDGPGAGGHEALGDDVGSVARRAGARGGSGPRDDARSAVLQVDGRDHLHRGESVGGGRWFSTAGGMPLSVTPPARPHRRSGRRAIGDGS